MTTVDQSKLQSIRFMLHSQAIDAMNNGDYITIIFYVRVPRGTDYIAGQTYKNCHLQLIHQIDA